jgi:hypothetical protein
MDPRIIKLFTDVNDSVMKKASVFDKACKKRLTITKALAYYGRKNIYVKSTRAIFTTLHFLRNLQMGVS